MSASKSDSPRPDWVRKKLSKRWLERFVAQRGGTYCEECRKIGWPTLEAANNRVEEIKSHPSARRPYLLEAYRCPAGKGWHVGHNDKLQWISLCTGEHK